MTSLAQVQSVLGSGEELELCPELFLPDFSDLIIGDLGLAL
jgi:hypothetical protein